MLTEFFWMNANDPQAKATKYFYKDFPASFVWNKQSKTWKARQQKDVIGRIVSANPNEGERYYLRLLLTHIPGPKSTFREAAIAHGILEDDQSNDKWMEEGCAFRMPISLRQLFSTILVYCSPKNPKELFLKYEEAMGEDYSLKDFQLSDLRTTEITKNPICKEILDEINLQISQSDLASITLLNEDQTHAYKR
ncbi:uncharacterized protein LOC131309666 [Rhododendron vialii]|uniref:uncharacterized protein LOC131309666 n=1 Tax=Rhododendron vialii TaxID=182163 RepID=UPI00265E0C59|nr:uncharacterized protein LOC131309666 [Rhododendron vialii]